MPRRREPESLTEEQLRAQMLRGITRRETVAVFDACGERLRAQGLWDAISMRDVREACLLTDAEDEYRQTCIRLLREGDPKGAALCLKMEREAGENKAAILARWGLVPVKRRGRPAGPETPEDLKPAAEDDGWETFGQEVDG